MFSFTELFSSFQNLSQQQGARKSSSPSPASSTASPTSTLHTTQPSGLTPITRGMSPTTHVSHVAATWDRSPASQVGNMTAARERSPASHVTSVQQVPAYVPTPISNSYMPRSDSSHRLYQSVGYRMVIIFFLIQS